MANGFDLWRITDHICVKCSGRLLTRFDDDKKKVIRCSDCGVISPSVKSGCWCGVKLSNSRDAGFRCTVNPKPTPGFEAEIININGEYLAQ